MCPLMPIYLSFSPVEPFSKSHIIVRSHWPMLDDGVAVAFRYQKNNRLIRNQMLFNMPFCNLKRRRKEIVCFLFILHHCKRMFCSFAFPYFVSNFFTLHVPFSCLQQQQRKVFPFLLICQLLLIHRERENKTRLRFRIHKFLFTLDQVKPPKQLNTFHTPTI